MSTTVKVLFVGDLPTLEIGLIDDENGQPIGDITGATVKLLLREEGETSNRFTNEDASIFDGPNAIIRYTFDDALTDDDVGLFRGQVRIALGQEVRFSEFFNIRVKESLG